MTESTEARFGLMDKGLIGSNGSMTMVRRNRARNTILCEDDGVGSLYDALPQSGIQWDGGIVYQNLQTGLRSDPSLA